MAPGTRKSGFPRGVMAPETRQSALPRGVMPPGTGKSAFPHAVTGIRTKKSLLRGAVSGSSASLQPLRRVVAVFQPISGPRAVRETTFPPCHSRASGGNWDRRVRIRAKTFLGCHDAAKFDPPRWGTRIPPNLRPCRRRVRVRATNVPLPHHEDPDAAIANPARHSASAHTDLVRRSPHVDQKPARVRYLRLTILEGEPGLWECRVY